MAGEPKTGDRLFELICLAMKIMKEKYGVELVAWCTDDGPDGKKARRRIRELLTYIIDMVCWTHQSNLMIGDYWTLPEYASVIGKALEIVKWFNNHGTALSLFQKEQITTYSATNPRFRPRALILPVITRWTAHYLSVCRLLELKQAMRACVCRHEPELLVCAGKTIELKSKVESVMKIVNDGDFWAKLEW